MQDQLNFGKKSVYRDGYGIVAKLVMRDTDLSPEAKAIYAYICSFAGSGTTAFPSAKLMMHELNMGDKRFYKFRKQLTDKGYISILKQRNGNRREKNIYQIVVEPTEHSRFESVQNESGQTESFQDGGSNSNSTTNNSFISNSSSCSSKELPNKEVYDCYQQCGFGLLNSMQAQMLDADVEIYGKTWVIDAIKEAVRQGKYKLSYAEGILRNWKADGRKDDIKPSGGKKEREKDGSSKQSSKPGVDESGIGFHL